MRVRFSPICSLWLLAAAAPTQAQEAAPARAGAAALLEQWEPALVTVKVVLKSKMIHPGGVEESESTEEIQGVVVDRDGLIMLSSASFTTPEDQKPDEQFRVETTPSDFKVVFGNEDKEFAAFLAATDKKLGLGFVQVQDLEGREIKAVVFEGAAKPEVGDPVVAVSRLGKGYDHAPYFRTSMIAGRIKKPRKAWILDRDPAPDGLPVFTPEGNVVGAMVSVRAVDEESGGDSGFSGLFSMFMAGGGVGSSFLLPGHVVHALIEQAKKQAAELRAAEKTEKTEKKERP